MASYRSHKVIHCVRVCIYVWMCTGETLEGWGWFQPNSTLGVIGITACAACIVHCTYVDLHITYMCMCVQRGQRPENGLIYSEQDLLFYVQQSVPFPCLFFTAVSSQPPFDISEPRNYRLPLLYVTPVVLWVPEMRKAWDKSLCHSALAHVYGATHPPTITRLLVKQHYLWSEFTNAGSVVAVLNQPTQLMNSDLEDNGVGRAELRQCRSFLYTHRHLHTDLPSVLRSMGQTSHFSNFSQLYVVRSTYEVCILHRPWLLHLIYLQVYSVWTWRIDYSLSSLIPHLVTFYMWNLMIFNLDTWTTSTPSI